MPYDFQDIASSNAYAEAAAKGCAVRLPRDNELFVDIDDIQGSNWFHMNIGKIKEQMGDNVQITWNPSGTEGHFHVIVTLPRSVTDMERIALQSFLGSDLKREALSWVRLVNQDPNPTLFYEKSPLLLAETA